MSSKKVKRITSKDGKKLAIINAGLEEEWLGKDSEIFDEDMSLKSKLSYVTVISADKYKLIAEEMNGNVIIVKDDKIIKEIEAYQLDVIEYVEDIDSFVLHGSDYIYIFILEKDILKEIELP